MSKYITKDSGKREEFKTGSRRDVREGKGRFDLISPYFLDRLAGILERGAVKYGDRNWEKGQPISRMFDSALRHINQARKGLHDEDHLAAAAWNLHCIIHYEEMMRAGKLPLELDDGHYFDHPSKEEEGQSCPYVNNPQPVPLVLELYIPSLSDLGAV